MTDGQWALLAPLLRRRRAPAGAGGRPEKWDRRLVLDAIFYQTVYALFGRWTRARTWCRI